MISIKITKLIWDDWNIAHIARHNVVPEEVEEVCHSVFVALDGHSGRFVIIGQTHAERVLAVILDPEPTEGEYYPVTAYSADKKDRRMYQLWKGGDANENAA